MQLTFNVARRKLIVVSLVIKITFIEKTLEIFNAAAEKSCLRSFILFLKVFGFHLIYNGN